MKYSFSNLSFVLLPFGYLDKEYLMILFNTQNIYGKVPRLKKITADMGYKIAFKEHIEFNYKWTVEVMQKPESTTGFIPQKNRWQVERSFGWLNFRRRMFRDVEKTILSSEAMTQIAFISLIINRL